MRKEDLNTFVDYVSEDECFLICGWCEEVVDHGEICRECTTEYLKSKWVLEITYVSKSKKNQHIPHMIGSWNVKYLFHNEDEVKEFDTVYNPKWRTTIEEDAWGELYEEIYE